MSLKMEAFRAGEAPPGDFWALHQKAHYRQADEALWPGAEALLVRREGQAVGRLSLSLAPHLHGLNPGTVAGVIGHYEADDPEAAEVLLVQGLERLGRLGARTVVGPMNRSTWHRYRFALPGDQAAPFPGEPENRERYALDFEAAGFQVLERYESRSVDLSHEAASRGALSDLPGRIAKRWQGRCRPLRLDRYEEELEALYALSLQAFDAAVLYTPIAKAEFLALYRPLKPLYAPDLVRLAEDEQGRLCGYLIAYRDGRRCILKTLACREDTRASGLASWLILEVQRRAQAQGCTQSIHALMHVSNRSASLSKRWSREFRSYALYAKELAS